MWYGLQALTKYGISIRVPESINDLRRDVMNEVCKNPEMIGDAKVRKYIKN